MALLLGHYSHRNFPPMPTTPPKKHRALLRVFFNYHDPLRTHWGGVPQTTIMKGDAALSVPLVFIHLRACLLGGIWGILLGTSSRFVKLYKWNIAVFRKQRVSDCRNMWMKRNSFIIKSQHTNRQQCQQLVKVHGTYLPSLGCLVNSLHTPMAWVTSLRLFRSNWIRPRVAPTTSTKIWSTNSTLKRKYLAFCTWVCPQFFWGLATMTILKSWPKKWYIGWNHHLDDYIHDVYSAGINRERVRIIICLLLINMNLAPEILWKIGNVLHTSWYQLPTSITFFQGHGWHVLCRAISSLGEKFATGGPQSFWAKTGPKHMTFDSGKQPIVEFALNWNCFFREWSSHQWCLYQIVVRSKTFQVQYMHQCMNLLNRWLSNSWFFVFLVWGNQRTISLEPRAGLQLEVMEEFSQGSISHPQRFSFLWIWLRESGFSGDTEYTETLDNLGLNRFHRGDS